MTMLRYIFSLLALLVVASCEACGACAVTAVADTVAGRTDAEADSTAVTAAPVGGYYRRIHRYRRHWENLIPTQSVIQYAGNMGVVSVGMGWEYGRRKQWETNLLFGYLPRFRSHRAKITMTLKENFVPWSCYLGDGWAFEPLSCGLYLNTVFGHEFWDKQPHRYPDKYYPLLSTKVRINVFAGQRIEKTIPHNKRKFIKNITAFYEVSTCDLYIRAMVQDDKVSLWDILGLSLGLKFQMF